MAKFFTKNGDDYESVEAFLQSDVDEIVKIRLEREREKYSDYESLKEQAGKVDAIKSEFEGKLKVAGEEKSELEKKVAAANLDTEKVKIIHEFKLSDELSEFVTGDTTEDLRQKAEKLSKGIEPGKVTIEKTGKPKDDETDSKVMAGKLFGKSDD
jgi:hypothetical protein